MGLGGSGLATCLPGGVDLVLSGQIRKQGGEFGRIRNIAVKAFVLVGSNRTFSVLFCEEKPIIVELPRKRIPLGLCNGGNQEDNEGVSVSEWT